MERFFTNKRTRLLSIAVSAVLWSGCNQGKPLGPIAAEYRNAGGGDPRSLPGYRLDGWLAKHQPFARELRGLCQSQLRQLDRTIYKADYRVCSSAAWNSFEPVKGDGIKF